MLRAKPDPSRSSHLFIVPNVTVRNGESLTMLRSNVDGEAGWSWVHTAANAYGFLRNDFLSAVASRKGDQPPTLDDLCAKWSSSFPQGYSVEEIRRFDLHVPGWFSANGDGGDSDEEHSVYRLLN